MSQGRGWLIFVIVILANMGLVGCRTSPIPTPTKNPVPVSMSLHDARLLIALSIDPSTKTNWKTSSTISQQVLKQMFSNATPNPRWSLEAVARETIHARFSHRANRRYSEYSILVEIHLNETEWWIVIVGARKLGFNGKRIHKNALVWVGDLEQEIRQTFSTYRTLYESGK